MAARVQFKSAKTDGGSSLAVTFDNPVTTGNLVVAVISCYYAGGVNAGTPWSVADTQSNSYTQACSVNLSGTLGELEIFSAKNVTGGSSFQVTITAGAGTYLIMTIIEYSGADTSSPLDQTATHSDASSQSTYTSTSATTTQAAEILVGACHLFSSDTTVPTPDSPWSKVDTFASAGLHEHIVQDQIVSSISTYSSTGTLSSAQTFQSCAMATFKASGGGGGSPLFFPANLVTGSGGPHFSNPLN